MKNQLKKITGNEGKAKIIIIILLIIIIAVAVCLWLFKDKLFGGSSGGQGDANGTGTSASDTAESPSDSTPAATEKTESTTEAPDDANAKTFTITVSEDKISCNGTDYATADELKTMLKANIKGDSEIVLVDNKAILATYNSVKDMLDAEKITYSIQN